MGDIMGFILFEALANALTLNLGFFINLVMGNLALAFLLLVLFGMLSGDKQLLSRFVPFMLLLWGLLGMLSLMGWKSAPFLEFGLFNLGLLVLDKNTRFEKYHVPILVGAFLIGSWLVS